MQLPREPSGVEAMLAYVRRLLGPAREEAGVPEPWQKEDEKQRLVRLLDKLTAFIGELARHEMFDTKKYDDCERAMTALQNGQLDEAEELIDGL